MGFRDSWVAVFDRRPPPADLQLGLFGAVASPARAPAPSEIADLLGMPSTGERAELLDVGVHAVALPTLWTVVVASGADHLGRLTPAHAERLSALGFDAVFLEHSEGTGRARIEVYEGGRRVWETVGRGAGDGG
jgi:hypothetical protein